MERTRSELSLASPTEEMAEAYETIRALQQELAETNRGLVALTLELEQRVDERTAELLEAQQELRRTNTELIQLTMELEDRVERRTLELQAKNEEVRTMSQQLWQAAKLATMGELAASIAHELNNPLATVSLRVESLLMRIPEGPNHDALGVVAQEVERMSDLVANLLQFSRRTGQQVSTLDVHEEIEKTLELIHHHLRKHGIEVMRDFVSPPPMVIADRQQIRQLFLNLFANATDAMPGGGCLTVRIVPAQRNGQLTIEVIDSGSGIPPEVLPRVMDSFFTTKPEGKGTGLGLAICRRIVQEHHGNLELESEGVPGRGTTVRISLPCVSRRWKQDMTPEGD
jgi:signal transduction histidine kinase